MLYFGRNELKRFLELALSYRERDIALSFEKFEGLTFSGAARALSKSYPESSIKVSLKRMESMGLLSNGTVGSPLIYTEFGKSIREVLKYG